MIKNAPSTLNLEQIASNLVLFTRVFDVFNKCVGYVHIMRMIIIKMIKILEIMKVRLWFS